VFYTSGVARTSEDKIMGKGVAIALVLIVGVLCYLTSQGVTVKDAVNWTERQFGVRSSAGQELKSVPYHNYAPAVK